MSRVLRLAMLLVLVGAFLPVAPALAQPSTVELPAGCGPIDSPIDGSDWVLCLPAGSWNGDLVIFAHGYISPIAPDDQWMNQLLLPDGKTLPGLVTGLHYAFAATSYSKKGLAVLEGVADVAALATSLKAAFAGQGKAIDHIYLTGVSEGALITTLALENYPDLFAAGMASCGPVGSFQKQVDYWGDFRATYDQVFPEVMPGTAIHIPDVSEAAWEVSADQIAETAQANPLRTTLLLHKTGAPFDPTQPATKQKTVMDILEYNFFATNEGREELHGGAVDFSTSQGNPYGRFGYQADPDAQAKIEAAYTTQGRLSRPLVTMHTMLDPVVPYWHEELYRQKVANAGKSRLLTTISILRYGHCAFTPGEALFAFGLMVYKASSRSLAWTSVQAVLPDEQSQADYQALEHEYMTQQPGIFLPFVQQ